MSHKLNEIYRSVLLFAGLTADDQGFISATINDKREPTFINGLRLVLPTDNQLRSFDSQERIVFHPFTENILRGESEVLTKLRQAINVRLNYTISVVGNSLLNLVASPAMHKNFSPEQAKLLTSVSDVDSKTVSNFISQTIGMMKQNAERVFVNIYLKRGATVKDKRYARGGIVSFPMYEMLLSDDMDKIRVKDKETFKQLLEFIFPSINEEEYYNFGSDSNVAPFLEALMRTAANIASRLNDILLLYTDFIEDADKVMFDSEWMDYFQDLEALTSEIRKVPVQHGNAGTASVPEQAQAPATPMTPAPQAPYPVPQQGYQQPMAPQAPGIRKTSKGLDFQSLMAHNQSIAMAPNPLHNQVMREEQQRRQAMAYNGYPQQPNPAYGQPMQPQQGYAPGTILQGQNGASFIVNNAGQLEPYNPQMQQPPMYGQPMMQPQPMYDAWGQPIPPGYGPR